ncbi:hypothetical protein AM593_10003, partial [Mytilus galloprovincialis]
RNRTFQCQESVQCEDTLHCIRGTCQCYVAEYWTQTACAKNICAVEQCMNCAKCMISGHSSRCICKDGYLGDKCQYANGRARDFIVIFPQTTSSTSPRILLAVNRRVHLSVFYFANNKNLSVTLSSSDNYYTLDKNVLMTNGLNQAGAKVHSNVPINQLYGFLFVRAQSEGFLVFPSRYVSTEYIVPSFSVFCSSCQSLFALTSVYSNTKIEINFRIQDGSAVFGNKQYSNNETLVLVLNMNTAFQIWHTSDLIGTRITASKPLLVVSGHKYNRINGKGAGQTFLEMVLPTNQLDNVYVIPYLNYRLENTVRVLAVNDTNVALKNVNNRTTHVLKSRDFLGYFHSTISYVSSTSDVMVHIYPHELPNAHGDAFMMTIPGINQYLYDYEIMVPIDFESFISITVPTNAVEGFVLD